MCCDTSTNKPVGFALHHHAYNTDILKHVVYQYRVCGFSVSSSSILILTKVWGSGDELFGSGVMHIAARVLICKVSF